MNYILWIAAIFVAIAILGFFYFGQVLQNLSFEGMPPVVHIPRLPSILPSGGQRAGGGAAGQSSTTTFPQTFIGPTTLPHVIGPSAPPPR